MSTAWVSAGCGHGLSGGNHGGNRSYLDQPERERTDYMAACRAKFADTDLVFFNPDNGIETSTVKKGRKESLKYAFLDEIADAYSEGEVGAPLSALSP